MSKHIEKIVQALERIISDCPSSDTANELRDVIEDLTDPRVFLSEWNTDDIQQSARAKLAFLNKVPTHEVIENPLHKDTALALLDLFKEEKAKTHRFYNEISWYLLDRISLPAFEEVCTKDKICPCCKQSIK